MRFLAAAVAVSRATGLILMLKFGKCSVADLPTLPLTLPLYLGSFSYDSPGGRGCPVRPYQRLGGDKVIAGAVIAVAMTRILG